MGHGGMGHRGPGPQAREEFFLSLDAADQAKMLALFRMLAETGRIPNREKFKSLGEGLFEFKSFQLRFLGDFRPGRRFVIAFGLRKKKDKLDRADIETAVRILRESA